MSIQAVAWVLDHSKSRGIARLVLIALANHHNGGTGQCNPGIRTLARECGISNRGVELGVARLVALGELVVDDRGGPRWSAKYRLTFSTGVDDADPQRRGVYQVDAEATPGVDAASTPGVDRTVMNRNETIEDDEQKELHIPSPEENARLIAEARAAVDAGRSKAWRPRDAE